MRIAMATLADAVNVREGMLSVLSAGVNMIGRSEFPSSLGATLALMLEIPGPVDHGTISIQGSLVQVDSQEKVKEVGKFEANIDYGIGEERSANIPMPIPLETMPIPEIGSYELRIQINEDLSVILPFRAELVTPLEDAARS